MTLHEFAHRSTVMALAAVMLALPTGPALAQSSGTDAFKALVEQAKKEPARIDGSMTRVLLSTAALIQKANQLFNKQFGLNKTINIVEGTDNTFTSQMMAALDLGGQPKLAFYTTNGGNIPLFVRGNYAAKISNWEALLAEINPRVKAGVVKPGDVSRPGYAGYAFAHSNRLKGVGYNKTLVSLKDLPKAYAEMADPKYKGQYAIEPWTSHWEALGFNYHPNRHDEFLGILDAIGKNTYVVARSHQLIPRMAQGEVRFMTLNAEVVTDFLAKNPGAPLDFYFMNDLTLVETTLMFVPRNSPAPATAALWVMFLSHPEVQAMRGPDAPNIMYGELPGDKYMQERLKGKNPWDWKMNAETTAYSEWINSKQGKGFRSKIRKAIRQRR
jgi:ABC-type Fe3+ transport system substrate-binding protein